MKKITVLLSIVFISLSSMAQKKDTATVPYPPDSIKIISVKDLNTFYKYMEDNISVSVYKTLTPDKVLQLLANWILTEYVKPKK